MPETGELSFDLSAIAESHNVLESFLKGEMGVMDIPILVIDDDTTEGFLNLVFRVSSYILPTDEGDDIVYEPDPNEEKTGLDVIRDYLSDAIDKSEYILYGDIIDEDNKIQVPILVAYYAAIGTALYTLRLPKEKLVLRDGQYN